jgi:hypothetical protein
MINNKLKKYIFIKNLDEKIKKNIKKLNNVQIIFNNEHFDSFSLIECIKIKDFCSIQFYLFKYLIKLSQKFIFHENYLNW